MSVICAGLTNKGKVGVQRGRKTAGCPSSLPIAVGTASSPPQRRRIPPLRFSEKLSAPLGRTRLRQFECPAQLVLKRRRPSGANPPAAVRAPRSAGAEKEPPRQGEPACGSSCAPVNRCRKAPGSTRDKNFQENMRYPLAKYAKIGYYIQALFCMNSRIMLNDVKNTIIWRHSDYDRR